LTTGEELNAAMHQINPYDLDGDWCVVGFIGGQLDRPFILRWWPHARNNLDPATSGRGNPDASGVGRALEQAGRYFRRINGVETVVTSKGDIIVSTTFAGGEIQPGEAPVRGRFSRSEVDEGGDVRIYMKPSRTVEWTWDPQVDGIGAEDSAEPELPQPNPAIRAVTTTGIKEKTFITINENSWRIWVPVSFEVTSSDTIRLSGQTSVTLESTAGSVAINAVTMLDLVSQGTISLTAAGALTVGGSSVSIGPSSGGAAPAGPGLIVGDPSGITLGEGGVDALVKGTTTAAAWGLVILPPEPTDLATALTAIKANTLAIQTMISGLALSATSKTL
jgi:hypothetical protein